MLIALYQESESDFLDPFGITFGKLVDRYGLARNERWLDRLAKEWQQEGLAEISDHLGPASEFEIEITGRGMRAVEERYGGKDGVGTILEPVPANVLLTEDGQPIRTEDGGYILLETPPGPSSEAPIQVSSENWTGLPRTGTLSVEATDRLKVALKAVENAVAKASCSNEERAQARAYIFAINALAEAPDPPADLIWKLVERANSFAGIASLFVALVALFTHA
jgi:hypothetical protein